MICYRDITFCDFYQECKKGYKCDRALTPEILSRARALNFPIAKFVTKPECFEESK